MDDPETVAYRSEVTTLVQSTHHLDAPDLLKKVADSWDKHQDLKADLQRHNKIRKIKNREKHAETREKMLDGIVDQELKLNGEVMELNEMFDAIPLKEFTDFEPDYLKLAIANDPYPHYKMVEKARDDLVREEAKIMLSPSITREQISKFREMVYETKLTIKRCLFRTIYIIENSEEIEKAKLLKIQEREKKMQEEKAEEEEEEEDEDEEEHKKMLMAHIPTEEDEDHDEDDEFGYREPFY